MSGDLRIENILIQVRSKLQESGIKLWLSPFYEEGIGAVDDEIEKLATDYSQILNIPLDYCRAAISELQSNAVDKLRARAEFAETGLATIKVRAPNQLGGTRLVTTYVKLSETGNALQKLVAKELGTCPSKVKLISAGKIIDANKILADQHVQNNQQIMAVIMETLPNETVAENGAYDRVQKAREDAQLLLSQKSQQFMQMEDQQGNAIHLPPSERNSLMMALAMHEKGKAELKKANYTEALLLFLDADNEFNQCNSKLLESVDNYALLNLDIAWCYLCLKSVMQLPDAEKRLRICEANFKKSYGENLDRVLALKGNAGNEKTLIMRLHLLQGVVFFHQNRRNEAQNMIFMAQTELNRLKISEESILTLVTMGYTVSEARLGLRACDGNIERTVTHIIENRTKRREADKRSRKERNIMKKVGASKDDRWVNPRSLTDLVDMGFPNDLCVVALKLTNNNVAEAINMLQNNQTALQEKLADDFIPDSTVADEMVKMGFNREIVNMSLRYAFNNMDEAVDMLLRMQSEGAYDNLLTNVSDSLTESMSSISSGATTSSSPATLATPALVDVVKRKLENDEAAMAAFERFSEGVSTNDDEYLDSSLVMEENVLTEYKKHLDM